MSSAPLGVLGFIAVGIPALLLTRWIVRTIERRRRSDFVNDMMDALHADREKPSAWEQLLTVGKFALLIPIWPIASAAVFIDVFRRPRQFSRHEHDEQTEFVAYGYLKEQVSVDEAQKRETVLDPCGERPSQPFGHLWETWQRFLAIREPGVELWAYEAPVEYHKNSGEPITAYSRGYCWVRDGKILQEFAVEGFGAKPFGKETEVVY